MVLCIFNLKQNLKMLDFELITKHMKHFSSYRVNGVITIISLSKKELVTLLCLFDLFLYVPSTIFQLSSNGSSWVEPILS